MGWGLCHGGRLESGCWLDHRRRGQKACIGLRGLAIDQAWIDVGQFLFCEFLDSFGRKSSDEKAKDNVKNLGVSGWIVYGGSHGPAALLQRLPYDKKRENDGRDQRQQAHQSHAGTIPRRFLKETYFLVGGKI
jgi:hypothetical protein